MCCAILFQFISIVNLEYLKKIILYSLKIQRSFEHSLISWLYKSLMIDSKFTNN